jgi:hypothetical protein
MAMMEAVSTSEKSVNFYQITRRNNPEDGHLHTTLLHYKNQLVNAVIIIADYSENDTIPINTICCQNAELLIAEVGGTYSYHGALKG